MPMSTGRSVRNRLYVKYRGRVTGAGMFPASQKKLGTDATPSLSLFLVRPYSVSRTWPRMARAPSRTCLGLSMMGTALVCRHAASGGRGAPP
eukprot:1422482-Pyramimonas_sp.AAC.1